MKDLSPHIKSFKEISEEYEFAFNNIERKTEYYNKLISKGLKVPSAGAYYKYSTLSEAEELKRKLKLEIDRKYTLELTGSFEAKLVYYFKKVLKRNHNLHQKKKKNVPNKVRCGSSPLMFTHILSVYKDAIQPIDNITYAEFKKLVEFRNWLAHGRGWDIDINPHKFDFEYSFMTIEKIIQLMPNFPDSLK